MSEEIEYTAYDKAMMLLAAEFEEALKTSLAKPYPFAPGYSQERQAFGIRNMKVKTGSLYKSIDVKFNPQKNEIIVSMLDYWADVNYGRKKGKYVPIKPLMAWIRAKGFNKNKETGKFQKFNIKGMAFAVSKNIQKFGIDATYFYDNAFKIFKKRFEDDAIKALGIDVQQFFNKIIDPLEREIKTK
jgi:hypothetical protein